MYRAHPSWFMDIQGQKDEMLAANAKTRWTPDNLRTGRFNNIIEQAPDWNLSRDRYWATPIPVWKGSKNDGTEVVKVFGSYAEFAELTGKTLDDYHLPEVMNVTFELDGVTMHHIGKVLDCWFESGSMPFAQFHYPFENKEKFEANFPADFIIEAIDQTRGWFYSLMAVNVGLFGQAPWKNLICTGFINAADGKKMSKKLKNYTDPMELMDKYSADSFRFLMLSSPLVNGENFALADKDVGDVARKLSMVWNMYDFFTMYADGTQRVTLPLSKIRHLLKPRALTYFEN
jgi:isoleucyl-tRNA synthetase